MKNQTISFSNVTIAYFSGTGGTEYAANCLAEQLSEKGIAVTKINIAMDQRKPDNKTNLLVILAPVYAFRLASIMEKWTKMLPDRKKTAYAAIISVSGGGDISPNTACRLFCKKVLKAKGYRVLYEKMLLMPSNFAIQVEESLNVELVRVMPQRINKIANDLMQGKIRQTKPYKCDQFLAILGKVEHFGAMFFGWTIHASNKCIRCGKCVRNCPVKNIRMKNGKPQFSCYCMWCMKCIYACPCKALSPRILKCLVLKNGFDMQQMIQKSKTDAKSNQSTKSSQSTKSRNKLNNILWQGVFDYLKERGE